MLYITHCVGYSLPLLIQEPDINFSDHLPLFLTIAMSSSGVKSCDHSSPNIDVIYPSWDKADTAAYYGETGVNLAPVLQDLDRLLNYDKCNIDKTLACDIISELYERIVFVLRNSERQFVPKHRKIITNSGGMRSWRFLNKLR